MRASLLRFALALTLPAAASMPAFADTYYYDDGQPPAALALFGGINYMGEVREAFDPFSTLHDLAFNDRARSVAVLAGQWELCEHHNFTGRCVFIRDDVADLSWFGLEGRVTSIRPVFEYTEAQHGLMFSRDNNGYIRYAHEQSWGNSSWNYGYSSSMRVSVQHYGYSPDYWRFGYYDPRWGFDPYGFAWSSIGTPRYVSYHYRVHPRPVVINNYWKKNWSSNHKHWNRRGHKEDWRRSVDWGGDRHHTQRPGNTHRPGIGQNGPRHGTEGGRRDNDVRGRPGQGNRHVHTDNRVDNRDRGIGPSERDRRYHGLNQQTDRSGPPRTGTGPLPTDPRSGNWHNVRNNNGSFDSRTGTGGDRRNNRPEGQINVRDRTDRGHGTTGGRRDQTAGTPNNPPAVIAPPRTSPPERTPGVRGDRPGRDGVRQHDRGNNGGLMGGPGAGSPRPVVDGNRRHQADGVRPAVDRGRTGEVNRPHTPRQNASPRTDGNRGGEMRGQRADRQPSARPQQQARPQNTGVSRPSAPPRVERAPRGGADGGHRRSERPGRSQD